MNRSSRRMHWLLTLGPAALLALAAGCRPAQPTPTPGLTPAPGYEPEMEPEWISPEQQPGMPEQQPGMPPEQMPYQQVPPPEQTPQNSPEQGRLGEPRPGEIGASPNPGGEGEQPGAGGERATAEMTERQLCDQLHANAQIQVQEIPGGAQITAIPRPGGGPEAAAQLTREVESRMRQISPGDEAPGEEERCALFDARRAGGEAQVTEQPGAVVMVLSADQEGQIEDVRERAREFAQTPPGQER